MSEMAMGYARIDRLRSAVRDARAEIDRLDGVVKALTKERDEARTALGAQEDLERKFYDEAMAAAEGRPTPMLDGSGCAYAAALKLIIHQRDMSQRLFEQTRDAALKLDAGMVERINTLTAERDSAWAQKESERGQRLYAEEQIVKARAEKNGAYTEAQPGCGGVRPCASGGARLKGGGP